jgi:predicted MFS family arabinose efflux permease
MTPRRWSIYLSGGFGLSVSAMLGLLVPLRADELSIPLPAIGLIVAAYSATAALLAVPLSLLITRLGTRGAFIASTGGCAALTSAFTIVNDFWTLLLLNGAVGAVSTLGWVASQTYISGWGRPEERARNTGRFSFVSNASQMATPLMVGASAAALGYRSTFLVVASYCGMFALVGAALPSQDAQANSDRVRLTSARDLFRLPRLQVAMLLTFVRLWVPTIWRPFLPLLLVTGGASPELAGAVVALAAAVAMGVSLLTGRLSRYASPEAVCTIALAIAVAGLVLSPHLLSVPGVLLPAAMVGIGNGLSLPLLIALVGEAAPPGQRGLALGTRNAVNSLSGTLAPLGAAPVVATLGATAGFGLAGGVAGALLGLAVLLQRRPGPPAPLGR